MHGGLQHLATHVSPGHAVRSLRMSGKRVLPRLPRLQGNSFQADSAVIPRHVRRLGVVGGQIHVLPRQVQMKRISIRGQLLRFRDSPSDGLALDGQNSLGVAFVDAQNGWFFFQNALFAILAVR